MFSFQFAFFCLAFVLSVAMAIPTESLEEDDLDFDVRGPAGLKKCQDLIEKNKALLKACKKSGSKKTKNKFNQFLFATTMVTNNSLP